MERILRTLQDEESAGGGSAADDSGPTFRTFQIAGGLQFINDFDTTLRLDVDSLGWGTEVDFENDLGLEGSTQAGRIDASFRFNRSHAVNFSWLSINRLAGRTIDRDIQWGELLIPAGSGVSSSVETQDFKLAYQYMFAATEDAEFGLSAGLHAMRFGTGISFNTLGRSAEFRQNLPLPVIGLQLSWDFAEDWRIKSSAEAFYIVLSQVGSLDSLEGYLIDASAAVEFDVTDFAGLGVGANYFQMDASAGAHGLTLRADYKYLGGLAFVRVYF